MVEGMASIMNINIKCRLYVETNAYNFDEEIFEADICSILAKLRKIVNMDGGG